MQKKKKSGKKKERVEVLGERRQVDSVTKKGPRRYLFFGPRKYRIEKGRILQKRRKIKEQRYIQVFEKGEIKELPWKVVADIEEEVETGQFEDVS